MQLLFGGTAPVLLFMRLSLEMPVEEGAVKLDYCRTPVRAVYISRVVGVTYEKFNLFRF